jgi:hypothetical protein
VSTRIAGYTGIARAEDELIDLFPPTSRVEYHCPQTVALISAGADSFWARKVEEQLSIPGRHSGRPLKAALRGSLLSLSC